MANRPAIKLRTSPPGTLLKLVTIVGWLLVVVGVSALLGEIGRWKESELAASAMFVFWGTIIGSFGIKRWRYGSTHLRVDLGRGTATYVDDGVDKTTLPLSELGTLVIETRTQTPNEWHELTATGLPQSILFSSALLLDVQQRRVQIERFVGQHAIRQLLGHDAPDAGAFRDDPELAFRARQMIPDRVRLLEVLAALSADPTVRVKVNELRAALER